MDKLDFIGPLTPRDAIVCIPLDRDNASAELAALVRGVSGRFPLRCPIPARYVELDRNRVDFEANFAAIAHVLIPMRDTFRQRRSTDKAATA